MDAASWLRVVSVPATRMLNASIRNSPASRRSPRILDANEFGEQIIGQALSPGRDHVVDVGVELVPRLQDDGLLFGEIAVEADDLEDVVGPSRELPPVLTRRSEQGADDRDRVGPRDIRDELAAARVGYADR